MRLIRMRSRYCKGKRIGNRLGLTRVPGRLDGLKRMANRATVGWMDWWKGNKR